ncbi:hypothetical protein ACOSZA_09495 [Mammaliicoccus sciuri]|uniref:hypothetical protein n=1 Tax=Mammaliicoccus sciuri TaxID=1296 RepID=UPI003BA14F09
MKNKNSRRGKYTYNKVKSYLKLLLKPNKSLELYNYKKMKIVKGIFDYLTHLAPVLAATYKHVHQLPYYIYNNEIDAFNHYVESNDNITTHPKI